jgi:hypothetical protein
MAAASGTGIRGTGCGPTAGARRLAGGAGRAPWPFRFLFVKRPCYDGVMSGPGVGEVGNPANRE